MSRIAEVIFYLACAIALGCLFAKIGIERGIAQEDARIVATCMDDNAKTVINGTTYECLSPELSEANRNALMLLKQILEKAGHREPQA